MKKSISAVITVILMMTLTACKGDVNTEINKRYMNLSSFIARAEITVTGNKGISSYEVSQTWREPEDYRLEVLKPENMQGTVYILKDGIMKYKSRDFNSAEAEMPTEEEYDFMLISDFLRGFYESGNIPEFFENADGKVVMNSARSSNNKNRFTQTLTVDTKSYLPESLVTYNLNGNEVLRVKYLEFTINPEIDETVFVK